MGGCASSGEGGVPRALRKVGAPGEGRRSLKPSKWGWNRFPQTGRVRNVSKKKGRNQPHPRVSGANLRPNKPPDEQKKPRKRAVRHKTGLGGLGLTPVGKNGAFRGGGKTSITGHPINRQGATGVKARENQVDLRGNKERDEVSRHRQQRQPGLGNQPNISGPSLDISVKEGSGTLTHAMGRKLRTSQTGHHLGHGKKSIGLEQ